MSRKIPISLPSTGDEEWQATREPLTTGWLTQGPKVAQFERAFAERHRVPHALATTLSIASIPLNSGPRGSRTPPAMLGSAPRRYWNGWSWLRT